MRENKKTMNKTFTLSEKSLIENCLNRKRKSQKELFDRFSPKMLAICLQYAKNQIDAEEILQNAFIKLFNNLHKFKGNESFEEWVRKIFINTATEYAKRNKVKVTINEDLKNIESREYITPIDSLYENIYAKTSYKSKKDNSAIFKLYAIDGFSVAETIDKAGITKSDIKTPLQTEKKSLIRVVQNTTVKNECVKLKYTLQNGDDRRLNKEGVLRVYNMSEPLDIPVKQVLGRWKKEHIGVTLIFSNEQWHIEGEIIKHTIHTLPAVLPLGLKRLLKFV